MNDIDDFISGNSWATPWRAISQREREEACRLLAKIIQDPHPLHGKELKPIGINTDNDLLLVVIVKNKSLCVIDRIDDAAGGRAAEFAPAYVDFSSVADWKTFMAQQHVLWSLANGDGDR